MQTATRNRPSTSAPSDGSRTMTITNDPTRHEGETSGDEGTVQPTGVLRLRAKRSGNRVAWGEDVVDNEGAGKKKSKICCIYHKPKRYDESSDESSDSEDEHSHNHASHSHSHSHPNGHSHGQASAGPSQQSQSRSEVHTLDLADDEEPNAYEQGPGRSKGKGKRNVVPESLVY